MASDRWVWAKPFTLPTNATSGSFTVDIPRMAGHIGILNGSGAKLAYSKGKNYLQPPDAVIVQPYIYLGLPMDDTQQLTVHWSSTGLLSSDENTGVLLFSNEPIAVTGGPMTTGGVASNVSIVGTPNINVSSIPNVTVTSSPQVVLAPEGHLPAGTNSIGTVGLNAGTNHIGEVAVNQLPAIPAGTNNIGKIDINSLPVGANHIGEVAVNQLPAIPAGANIIGQVQEAGSSSLTCGVVNASTTAAAFPSRSCREVLVQADPSNTDNVLVGDSGTQAIVLTPGTSLVIPVSNLSLLNCKSASGTQNLNYLTRG